MPSAQLRDIWESNFGGQSVWISHKNDWNRREWKIRWIEVSEAHALGADNVATLCRFYAKELGGIVTQVSFWYMSRNNVVNRSWTERKWLASVLRKRKQLFLDLAQEIWASIVPFGEINLLSPEEQEFFAEIEDNSSQHGLNFRIWFAVAYSRTPFLLRTIEDLRIAKAGFSSLSIYEQIQHAYRIMHKWLDMPNLYFISWAGDGIRTSDGFYDPDATHIYSTDVLWPNITWEIVRWAIIDMMIKNKVKLGA